MRFASGNRYLTAVSICTESQTKTCFMRFDNIDADPAVPDVAISLFMDGDRTLEGEEACIVKLPDGRLFAVMRSRFGTPLWTQSRDGGETWSDSKVVVDVSGRPILHPRAPCPAYDLAGDAAASGRYMALFTDAFDPSVGQFEGRGPLFRYDGEFAPGDPQPVRWRKWALLLPRDASTHYGNSCYSSFTVTDGTGVLWYPDNKRRLYGVRIPDSCAIGLD